MGPDLSTPERRSNGRAPFGFSRVVFLSHVLAQESPAFPGDPVVEIDAATTLERDGYYLQRLTCGEQSGTHWAAPAHFSPAGLTADELEPADFFFAAVILDHRAQAIADPDFTVSTADLERWEAAHGQIPERAAVLLLCGYDQHWNNPRAYLGTDENGSLHYPGFGAAAARWLVERRGIGALGTDTMGIDSGRDPAFAANRLLLSGHRIHLENLRGLAEMPAAGGWIVVGGVRPRAGSGSPATVFGLVP
jgi:kynurenine formamidase